MIVWSLPLSPISRTPVEGKYSMGPTRSEMQFPCGSPFLVDEGAKIVYTSKSIREPDPVVSKQQVGLACLFFFCRDPSCFLSLSPHVPTVSSFHPLRCCFLPTIVCMGAFRNCWCCAVPLQERRGAQSSPGSYFVAATRPVVLPIAVGTRLTVRGGRQAGSGGQKKHKAGCCLIHR